jgi:hypothetical protein
MKNFLLFMLMVAFSISAIAQVDLENGLVGYYKLDLNNVVDDTIVVNEVSGADVMPNGVIRNAPEWTDGISGDALLFNDQTSNHVAFGTFDPSANTEQLSVSVWLNWKGLDGRWHSVCGKRDGWDPSLIMWDICLDMNSGGVQFETNTASGKVFIITPEPPAIEDWTHIAVTFDGAWGVIYVNGLEVIQGDMTFGLGREAEFHLGAGTTGGIDPFNGSIDEFRVYNRVLNDDEVMALYNLPTSVDHNIETTISDFVLYQNYPNPFNPNTRIDYQLPQTANINISVYNTIGQLVSTLVDEVKSPGLYSVNWNATNQNGLKVPSGIYLVRMVSNNFSATRKLTVLK